MTLENQRIKLAILSAGLGHIHRGFEVAASRLFSGLHDDPVIEARLFCGGIFPDSCQCANFPRDGKVATALRRLTLIHDGCRLEQISFGVGVIGHLIVWRPDVVWIQEYSLGRILKKLRKLLGLRFQILFCDGAPAGPTASGQFDYVQHLHPASFDEAIRYGLPRDRMFVMPHWITKFQGPSQKSVRELQQQLGIDEDDFVVVSVAAWNRHHKRIDYLIKEVGAIQSDRVKLVLCGQEESDTPMLKALGQKHLPGRIHWITLPAQEVAALLELADAFVLASLNEGLGAALIESAVMGTPTIAHNHSAAHFILEDKGVILDLAQPLNLKLALEKILASPWSAEECDCLRDSARARFFDSALLPLFRKQIHAIATRQPLVA